MKYKGFLVFAQDRGLVMTNAVEIRACRILSVSYDTSICPPGCVAWASEDGAGGSMPVFLSDLSTAADRGEVRCHDGVAQAYRMKFIEEDWILLCRIVRILQRYLTEDHGELARTSYSAKWSVGKADIGD